MAALVAALAPSVARAQPAPQPQPQGQTPGAVPVDEARRQFDAGVDAMQHARWQEALTAFEESSRLRRTASVALNLGVVLRQMGHLVEARVRFQEFNELASVDQHRANDAEVTQMLIDIAHHLARLRVVELSPPSALITIDNRRAQLNEAGETVLDPGAHTVRAEAQGFQAHEERVEVAESATQELHLTLTPEAAPVVAAVTPHPVVATAVDPRVAPTAPVQAASHPIYTRWWFWTAIGVVAAAGATTAIVLTRGPRALPAADTTVSAIRVAGAP